MNIIQPVRAIAERLVSAHRQLLFVALAVATFSVVAQAPTCAKGPGPHCLDVPAASHNFTLFERSTVYTDNAGARRIFVGAPVELSDPRPTAVLAFAPQQPGSKGFFDAPFGAAIDSAVPAPPPSPDWSYTPRRSFQVRRR